MSEAAERYGFERWTTDGRSSSPIPRSGSSTTSARTHSTRSRRSSRRGGQARRLREAARARRRRELRDLAPSRGDRREAPVRLQLPLVPAVRLARELIDAGELGRSVTSADATSRTGRHRRAGMALRQRRGGIGGPGRPRGTRRRPRSLPRRRDRRRRRLPPHVHPRSRGRRRGRGDGQVCEKRRGRDARGDAARARPPERVPVGDQRDEGVARVRHGAPEPVTSFSGAGRRAHARVHERARLGGEPSVLGALVAAGSHRRLGRHLRARAAPLPRGDRRHDPDVAPHGATFEDGYRAAEVCDALVRSSTSGRRETVVYRMLER